MTFALPFGTPTTTTTTTNDAVPQSQAQPPQAQQPQHQQQQQHQPQPQALPQPPSYQQHQYPLSHAQQTRQQHHQPPPPPQQQQQQQQQHQAQQQQQLQLHQQLAMNGINGANMGGGPPLSSGPTPAGHQAELNYIYGMVEELSRQLADNRRVTEDIVSGLGRVRNRAKNQNLSNDELIDSAASDLEENQNLDTLVSILSESLEKANFSRDANATLLTQYANALALMLKQFHDYKAKHVADIAAWHRSYRVQLDEARQENSRLREQIWEMQTHASRANENLRQFRRKYDEDETRWDARVQGTSVRQELRFWKRMAMPELDDDDPYWSAEDDVIDEAEKERLRGLEARAAQEQMMDGQMDEDGDGQMQMQMQMQQGQQMGMHMGGIAMQRDESAGRAMPVPPPRPLSAASSTGSTGQ